MKLTAATITDEQIRGLCPRQSEPLYKTAEAALSRHSTDEVRRAARVRCAEIFNARSTK